METTTTGKKAQGAEKPQRERSVSLTLTQLTSLAENEELLKAFLTAAETGDAAGNFCYRLAEAMIKQTKIQI